MDPNTLTSSSGQQHHKTIASRIDLTLYQQIPVRSLQYSSILSGKPFALKCRR